MPAVNQTHIYRKYRGLWVGLKSDQKTVVASGNKISEVVAKAKKKGFENPILLKVPTKFIALVG